MPDFIGANKITVHSVDVAPSNDFTRLKIARNPIHGWYLRRKYRGNDQVEIIRKKDLYTSVELTLDFSKTLRMEDKK